MLHPNQTNQTPRVAPSSSSFSPPLSSSPSQATCRTCKSCRRKKIKCNGQHPQCGACQSRSIECVYPQDARRNVVRARKGDVRALQRKIEALQEKMEELKDPSPAAVSFDASITDSALGDSQTAPCALAPAQPLRRSGDIRERVQARVTEPEETRANVAESGTEARLSRVSASYPGINETPDTPLSPETPLAEDGPQVYGATSLLHDHSSQTPLANRKDGDIQNRPLPVEAIQDHLISNAALRKQDELKLKLRPSLACNIDLDGVPMDLAMHLLELHWNRQHLSYLLTYRPAIMDSLAKNGPYMNKLLLNAIYLQSSLYSDRATSLVDHQNTVSKGLVFYGRFKSLLPKYLDKPTIPTAVALLTCGACLVPYGYQSAGWAISGMGYQMVVDLGCHLISPVSEMSMTVEQEMKKRLYWGAFVGDKLQALFLGRPFIMHETTGNVTQDYLDSFEEMEEWKPYIDSAVQPADNHAQSYRGQPCYAISTFQSLLQLCKITAHILESFYSARSPQNTKANLLSIKDDVTKQLDAWGDDLPSWLQFDPSVDFTPPPHQMTPHALYWTLVILTEQAFINRGRFNFSLHPSLAEASRKRCIQAALNIWALVKAYKQAFTLRRAQYGISYATYCAALVMLQHTCQDNSEYDECIRFFWSALSEYQAGCCYGLKRPLNLLRSLMRRLGNVNIVTETVEPSRGWTAPANDPYTNLDMEADQSLNLDPWDSSLLDGFSDDAFWTGDSIFGMFRE